MRAAAILALLVVAAAGWFYMFYSRAAHSLTGIENDEINLKRIRLRRVGGLVMFVLAIFFFAGPHEDYHQPSDEVERLDTDKAARVARLVFLTTHAVATTPQRPQWTAEGLREVRRMTGGRD